MKKYQHGIKIIIFPPMSILSWTSIEKILEVHLGVWWLFCEVYQFTFHGTASVAHDNEIQNMMPRFDLFVCCVPFSNSHCPPIIFRLWSNSKYPQERRKIRNFLSQFITRKISRKIIREENPPPRRGGGKPHPK